MSKNLLSVKINALILYLFGLLVFLTGCKKSPTEEVIVEPESPSITVYDTKYLALGDSYTIGQSVYSRDRFPIQLARRLNADSISIDTTIIIAKTGWGTNRLINAIEEENLTDTFDLVSLLIGVNNQYQNVPISNYETEFPLLLQKAIELAGGDKDKVFVVSIPDYGYTPFGEANQATISPQIDAYNAINQSISIAEQVCWFDITSISINGLNDPDLVAVDDLHPSGKMYGQWVDLMYEEVKSKLE